MLKTADCVFDVYCEFTLISSIVSYRSTLPLTLCRHFATQQLSTWHFRFVNILTKNR